jgi:Transposase family tnp2
MQVSMTSAIPSTLDAPHCTTVNEGMEQCCCGGARYHAEDHKHEEGCIKDFMDGTLYKELLQEWPALAQDARNMMFAFVTDGVQPFKDDKFYSMWPFALVPLNFPPTLRGLLTCIIAIVPGWRKAAVPDAGKLDLRAYLEVMVDELVWLDEAGVQVRDSSKGDQPFTCYARLVQVRG